MSQYILVAFCVLTALGYALYRIRQTLFRRQDPCCGCCGCESKKHACNKKTAKIFGDSK